VLKLKRARLALPLLLATITLAGCAEPQVINQEQGQTVEQPAAVLQAGDYIQPTQVPTTNTARLAKLKSLNINADSPVQLRRFALFLRYAQLTNNQKPQLEVLEQLLVEVSELSASLKDDYELTALLGSATSLKTTFFLDNLGKTTLLSKKGSRYLDRAVKKAPNHLGVRLYRGITYAEMPAFLGKSRQAVEDFKLLKAGSDAQSSSDFIAMVDYYYAMALIKNQQQDSGLERLAQLAQKNITPWSDKASKLIKQEG
jgi:hypothetical protein